MAVLYKDSSHDPCGYVEDRPCPALTQANGAVKVALQRATEIKESDASSEDKSKAFRMLGLTRLFANEAARSENGERATAALRAETIAERIGA
jgi:hypothetical protein